jgi:hypothetical protein
MNSLFVDKRIAYTGRQLRSHYIYEQFGIRGDAIIAFCGLCDVDREAMVDVEDRIAQNKIYSEDMLHFIVEHFDTDFERIIWRQILLAAIVQNRLMSAADTGVLTRKGSDIYDGNAKLSVSIATVSPVSSLIHFGVNISSAHTPVATKGLNDYGIDPHQFALEVMEHYTRDYETVNRARCKVRWVT